LTNDQYKFASCNIYAALPIRQRGAPKADLKGGIAPFRYTWSTGNMQDSVSGLVPGSYFVSVVDSAGCSARVGVVIVPAPTGVQTPQSADNGLRVFRNPAHNEVFVENLSADKVRVPMVLRDVTGCRVLQTEVPILRAGDRHP
jgi:hypothetical protein